jgi:serine/threonine-protein kinase
MQASDPPIDSEAELAELLSALTDKVRQGELPDIEAVASQHPRHAEELKHLWGAVMLAEGKASWRTGPPTPGWAPPAPGPNADPNVPRQFGGFEIEEEIGRGGMGVVYRAKEQSLGRTVALKMMLRGDLASGSDRARFDAEAASAAQLDHPNIVPVYEFGEHAGQRYFSMKYVKGQTLARRLASGPIPAREAAALLVPVCRAIHYAHSRGVLHRDLKPSNILIDETGTPHVTDFGLAKRGGSDPSLTRSGAILGTPCYMAPEQAAGNRGSVGPASDVYSLGAVLYQLLTGLPPFQAATPLDTVFLVLEQEPILPRLLNARADRDLEMVALRCLQKPPDLRYASAEDLAQDLERFLAGEPVAARSGGFGQVLGRWFRETHQAAVLENWGLLWMWHSLALVVLSVTTSLIHFGGEESLWPYLAVWTLGLGTWAAIFWALRRRAGPVTFVERQVAHVWAASVISIGLLFIIERLLDLPVLFLSPVLGLSSGMIFLVKAGMLTGSFYTQAAALFLTSIVMAVLSRLGLADVGITLFGVVSAVCFFVPGLKYHLKRRENRQNVEEKPAC